MNLRFFTWRQTVSTFDQIFAPGTDEIQAGDEPEPFIIEDILASIRSAAAPKYSGWPELDRLGVMFHPKELALIGARTGHGKTTVLINLLINWLQSHPDESILFYSYEIPVDAIFMKMSATLARKELGARWTFYDIRNHIISDGESSGGKDVEELEAAMSMTADMQDRFFPIYRPQWTADVLDKHARATAARLGNVGAILVDYLQLVPAPPGRYERRDVEVSAVARVLKRLAVDLSVPVVAAAQMSRESIAGSVIPPGRPFDAMPVQEAIKARRPQLHHLREGGSEQEADLVLGLLNYRADFVADREDAGVEDREIPGPLDLLVLKNRYGNLGVVSLVLEGTTGLIHGLSFRHDSEAAT
jgi:replicative DNA helicase